MLLDDGRGRKSEPRKALPLRVPQSLLEAVYRLAGWKKLGDKWSGPYGSVTPIVESAVRLYMHLDHEMKPDKPRWQQFALDQGLDWNTQWPEVVSRAAKQGLEQHEKHRK